MTPSMGTKKKRHALRRGPGLAAMPVAIMPMYAKDRMLVAKNAATSSENMVSSNPQFCRITTVSITTTPVLQHHDSYYCYKPQFCSIKRKAFQPAAFARYLLVLRAS